MESSDAHGNADVFHEAVGHALARGTRLCRALIAVPTARWSRLHGDPSEEGLAEAEMELRLIGAPWYVADTLVEHAKTLDALGRPDDAEPLRREAERVFRLLGAAVRADALLPPALPA